jgi:methylamine---glutamate N-methyltransferase subunit A
MSDMCDQLFRRGPDSAGVALYGAPVDGGLVVRVDLDRQDLDAAEGEVIAAADEVTSVKDAARSSRSLRLVVLDDAEGKLADVIEERVPGARVFSVGRSMEIVKDLGMACDINARYDLGRFAGTHGIGHTRMATESRVDIAHSHPFWARPFPDICVVHNGQITNYHKLRRRLEQKGHRFATENDSEVIAVYIADKLEAGDSLDSALRASIGDLDGTFAYLISTADGIGLARDQFATKPLLYAEDDEMVVLASEEISIRAVFPDPALVPRELQAKEVRWWLR